MKDRLIFEKGKKIWIFIDSLNIEKLLKKNDKKSKSLLYYFENQYFEFIRTPLKTSYEILKRIPEISIYKDSNSINYIDFDIKNSTNRHGVGYRLEDLEEIGKIVFNKIILNEYEKELIETVFIRASFDNNFNDPMIYITNEKKILKKRTWLENHFPGGILNIVDIGEASEIMGLFIRFNNAYFIPIKVV